MESGLRARLRAMGGTSGERTSRPTRGGLEVIERAEALPAGFVDRPDPASLRRLGVDFDWPPRERVLFLDTETTGLSGGAGTLAFLVGVGYARGDQFITRQLLMRDYPDEATLLLRLSEIMGEFDAVVTFNGRAFDLPLLASRYTMFRMREALPALEHLDLLSPSRRLWKKRLGSVRLSVLEEKVLRRGRVDDLPGSEAPRRFFAFLKTGERALLNAVVEHNRLDVVSMAHLLVSLLDAYAQPAAQREVADLLSLGRTMERQGEREEAIRCYRMASLPRPVTSLQALRSRRLAGEALFALGMLYKRLGEWDRAGEAWETLAERGQMGSLPMVELAKLCEHRRGDFEAALGWAECALATTECEAERQALTDRMKRLRRKIERQGGSGR